MPTLEEQLTESGVEIVGPCKSMSSRGSQLMHNSPLLEDFTAREADVLGDSMIMIRAKSGQHLIREGETGDWMLLILGGTVDVTKRKVGADMQPTDEVTRLAVIQRGASLGEMSMLDSEPRYASCVAIDDVEAAVLTRHAVAVLIRDHPGVGAKLLVKLTQLLAQRLRNTSNQFVKVLATIPQTPAQKDEPVMPPGSV